MIKQAYKKKYDYGNSEKYRIFLKQNLLKLQPRYYSVSGCKRIDTTDGIMYAVSIIQDIENPALEPIIEAFINDEYIYLWRDHCWAIAVDKEGSRIVTQSDCDPDILNIAIPEKAYDKIMVIHRIGLDTV